MKISNDDVRAIRRDGKDAFAWRHVAAVAAIALLAALTCGCACTPPGTGGGPSTATGMGTAAPLIEARTVGPNVPQRAALPSVSDLYPKVAASGNQALIGLKDPGAVRGVWGASFLVSRNNVTAYAAKLGQLSGVQVLYVDQVMPWVVVKVDNQSALQTVLSEEFVDYAESATGNVTAQDIGIGCSGPNFPTWAPTLDPLGDIIPRNFSANGVDLAWLRSQGLGVTVGVVDTGISQQQTEVLPPEFGLGGQRTIRYAGCSDAGCLSVLPAAAFDTCNHGTRVVGTIGAPRNGKSIVGVAPLASMVVEKAADGVAFEADDASGIAHVLAIREVRNFGARIIQMAFGGIFDSESIGDEIRFEKMRPDLPPVLFIAAAGSELCVNHINASGSWSTVMFPARMPEVLAVTGINADGTLESNSCSGPEVRLAVFLEDFEALGMTPGSVVTLGATSGASAIASGAAALVWSKYPSMTPDDVVSRLISTGGASQLGPATLNAHAAVGGISSARIVSSLPSADPGQQYTLQVQVAGDGPYAFSWNTGETTQTIGRSGPSDARVTIVDLLENTSLVVSRSIGPTRNQACLRACAATLTQCINNSASGLERQRCVQDDKACIAGC